MSLEKRVSALEAAAGAGDPSCGKPWQRVTVHAGQSSGDALRAAGIGQIGKYDNLIVRRLGSPTFDEQGRLVPLRSGRHAGIRRGSWRELCGL